MFKEPKWAVLALALLLGMTLGLVLPRGGDRTEPVETENGEVDVAAARHQDESLEQNQNPEDVDPSRTFAAPQLAPEDRCDPGKDEDCRDLMEMEDLGSDGPLGGRCETAENCSSPWECIGPPAHPLFVGGYCGLAGCESDRDCGPRGICADAFGGTYCLRSCRPYYCRHGYACRKVRGDDHACVPSGDDDDEDSDRDD